MRRTLLLEQTPAFSVPLRFFLTAPIFALIAGCLLFWHGPPALISRWSPATLALTHLLTLGFLAMTMIGALFQLLPVVAGVDVPRSRLSAGIVHVFLVLGAGALSMAFWRSEALLFKLALPALLTAFAWFLGACCLGLWRAQSSGATLAAIRMSLLALALAVGLGLSAASAFAWPLALPLMQITGLHVAWGLPGWVGLLIVGVAYQVVPMFEVTPLYPRRVAQWLAGGIFLTLCLWSAAVSIPIDALRWPSSALSILAGAGFAVFSVTTLNLLRQKKQAKPKASTLFWRTSLVSVLGCAGLWLAGEMQPGIAQAPSYPLALGILFIIGFGYTVINGMLYEIVPFLVWYHLQSRLTDRSARPPNMKNILPDRIAKMQFYAHLAALLLLLGATVWPDQFARAAAAAFIVSSGWLWLNILTAVRIYHRQ